MQPYTISVLGLHCGFGRVVSHCKASEQLVKTSVTFFLFAFSLFRCAHCFPLTFPARREPRLFGEYLHRVPTPDVCEDGLPSGTLAPFDAAVHLIDVELQKDTASRRADPRSVRLQETRETKLVPTSA